MKLTDTHLVLLSAAAQHADKLLVRPDCQRRSDVPQKRRFKIPQVT